MRATLDGSRCTAYHCRREPAGRATTAHAMLVQSTEPPPLEGPRLANRRGRPARVLRSSNDDAGCRASLRHPQLRRMRLLPSGQGPAPALIFPFLHVLTGPGRARHHSRCVFFRGTHCPVPRVPHASREQEQPKGSTLCAADVHGRVGPIISHAADRVGTGLRHRCGKRRRSGGQPDRHHTVELP